RTVVRERQVGEVSDVADVDEAHGAAVDDPAVLPPGDVAPDAGAVAVVQPGRGLVEEVVADQRQPRREDAAGAYPRPTRGPTIDSRDTRGHGHVRPPRRPARKRRTVAGGGTMIAGRSAAPSLG